MYTVPPAVNYSGTPPLRELNDCACDNQNPPGARPLKQRRPQLHARPTHPCLLAVEIAVQLAKTQLPEEPGTCGEWPAFAPGPSGQAFLPSWFLVVPGTDAAGRQIISTK
jgi:hypothetical protein